jgi:hypothetical protein
MSGHINWLLPNCYIFYGLNEIVDMKEKYKATLFFRVQLLKRSCLWEGTVNNVVNNVNAIAEMWVGNF